MHRLLDFQPDDPNPNLELVLYQDLVEIVPLIQSLIDRKANSSYFTRRASVAYTKTPSRQFLSKSAKAVAARKRREDAGNDADADSVLSFSARASMDKENEEVEASKVQVEDLRRELLDTDEALVEMVRKEASGVEARLEEVKREAAEKDCLIKACQRQLSDTKVKLADKQAALEKLLWEAMTSNRSAERLRAELDSLRGEISSFMILFGYLVKTDPTSSTEDYDISPCDVDQLPYIEYWDETQMQAIEAARKAYEAAVFAAKERQDEESIASAASARARLQSFLLET